MKTILFIGGSKEAVVGIKEAKKMCFNVIVSDIDVNAVGRKFADDFIQADVYNPEDTLRKVSTYSKKNRINGVITLGCDATITVSKVASALGVPGHSMKTAQLATNKILMKEQFKKKNIPIPWFSGVKDLSYLREIINYSDCDYVLKPVDSRGARGVLKINKSVDLNWAFKYSLSFSRIKKLIIEKWLEGKQISTESVLYGEKSVLVGVADRDYSRTTNLLPFIIEDGGETPAELDQNTIQKIDRLITLAAKAIGIKKGTVKGDIVIDKDGPKIIEIAARLSGGYFCTHNIPLVYGVNIIKSAIDISLGEEPNWQELKPRLIQYMANRFFFLPKGRVKSVKINKKQINSLKGLILLKLYIKKGDMIEKVTDHTKRSGVVITVGESKIEAIERANKVIQSVEFEVMLFEERVGNEAKKIWHKIWIIC